MTEKRGSSLVTQDVLCADLAQVQLDPVRLKVERNGIRTQVLGKDSLKLFKAHSSISVQVEKLEGNLCCVSPDQLVLVSTSMDW